MEYLSLHIALGVTPSGSLVACCYHTAKKLESSWQTGPETIIVDVLKMLRSAADSLDWLSTPIAAFIIDHSTRRDIRWLLSGIATFKARGPDARPLFVQDILEGLDPDTLEEADFLDQYLMAVAAITKNCKSLEMCL